EAARHECRPVARDVAGGRARRRAPPVRLQLPIRARRPPRARTPGGRRARRGRPLPRPLPPAVELGRGRDPLAVRSHARRNRRVLVTEPEHPFMRHWWPPGHILGWGDTFTHQLAHLLEAIAGEHDVAPHGATFEDGYRCDEVVEAMLRSAESGRSEAVASR